MEINVYVKPVRFSAVSVLTFSISKYTLLCAVVSSLGQHHTFELYCAHLVLSSFGLHGMHLKLMATTFQSLFPYQRTQGEPEDYQAATSHQLQSLLPGPGFLPLYHQNHSRGHMLWNDEAFPGEVHQYKLPPGHG